MPGDVHSLTSMAKAVGVKKSSNPDDSDLTETFRNITSWRPRGARGVFGGQVIAQALSAASQTAPNSMGLHSMHIYFLLPADAEIPIDYVVERPRDGKSYSSRLVKGVQRDKVIAVLMASYATLQRDQGRGEASSTSASTSRRKGEVTESKGKARDLVPAGTSMSHSLRFAVEDSNNNGVPSEATWAHSNHEAMERKPAPKKASRVPPYQPTYCVPAPPDVLPMRGCELEEGRWSRYLDRAGERASDRMQRAVREYIEEREASPFEIAVAKRRDEVKVGTTSKEPNRPDRMVWIRARDLEKHRPSTEEFKTMIAFMSDFQFIGTAARRIGLTALSTPKLGMLASLDHSIHFYPFPEGFDPCRPLLHVMEAVIVNVGPGRGVVSGRIYTEEGVLIAVTQQEGVVRAGGRPQGDFSGAKL